MVRIILKILKSLPESCKITKNTNAERKFLFIWSDWNLYEDSLTV